MSRQKAQTPDSLLTPSKQWRNVTQRSDETCKLEAGQRRVFALTAVERLKTPIHSFSNAMGTIDAVITNLALVSFELTNSGLGETVVQIFEPKDSTTQLKHHFIKATPDQERYAGLTSSGQLSDAIIDLSPQLKEMVDVAHQKLNRFQGQPIPNHKDADSAKAIALNSTRFNQEVSNAFWAQANYLHRLLREQEAIDSGKSLGSRVDEVAVFRRQAARAPK